MARVHSIIQSEKVCLLCGRPWGLELHHAIPGNGRRKIADREGLVVWLCYDHHRRLHDKGENDMEIRRHAQKIWMSVNGKTVEDFISTFGKSYLG